MDSIVVKGGGPLDGRIQIAGAKNTSLKLIAASILTEEPVTLTNVPNLADIRTISDVMESLGVEIARLEGGRVMVLSAASLTSHTAEYDLVRKLRASFQVLGPLLARTGEAIVSLPGGCAIGARPVDIHLDALEQMGAKVELRDGYVHASAPQGLKGCEINFRFASVGATENAMAAATLAKGTTIIRNAAREPDTVALAECLNAMGAQIEGAGTSTLTITGVDRLHGVTQEVLTDRIELGTFMVAPMIAGGSVELLGGRLDLIPCFADKMIEAGAIIEETKDGLKVSRGDGPIKPVDAKTEPFPGFPTDLQAQFMAMMCLSNGTSVLEETIFENRFMHAPELLRMGANVEVQGGVAKVHGVEKMKGAPVMATDLRASVSLILAGLAAEGETVVNRVYHLDRGYEHVERKLSAVGAQIERMSS
ncbi:UDP-N-acetylglucosamine 1-carboxyvinyltransferase [Cognatiyoonia sediminum]|uniref:UDP-N-acetylglucosamine 1-carboxyvinyltransferase n=1 Tax=Cognatiyoonia sediminum TaxID=1508389 RepID=A0A1M5SLE9_9RHOB|nr:UDP-N-acetylglucosamine 1-carboxyvinyltransferase [Cognatiyoonia sediminum]SHH39285.1 UDP-N-acetylglucosamine 1-carboxyvinyltransferase [Cognatiyoonia sediminum]